MAPTYMVVAKYQDILKESVKIKFSNCKNVLGETGIMNRLFCFQLCSDNKVFLEFCKETGLIRDKVPCKMCNCLMKFMSKPKLSDGYYWKCTKTVNKIRCKSSVSIRDASYFCSSKLTLNEIFLITYEIINGTDTTSIINEYKFSTGACAYWRQLINKQMLYILKVKSEKIGGNGAIIEITDSKFDKKIYNEDSSLEDQWLFGGVEKGSGKVFLALHPDNSKESLLKVIKEWIEPGTIVCSDSWQSSKCVKDKEFRDLASDSKMTFVDRNTKDNTTWKHVKVSHNKKGDQYNFAYNLFMRMCAEKGEDCLNVFLDFVKNVKSSYE